MLKLPKPEEEHPKKAFGWAAKDSSGVLSRFHFSRRPLRNFGLHKPNTLGGVVGLRGLGHLAVKFAKAMGVKVTVISTSLNKEKEAIEHHGADSFLVSSDEDHMQAAMGTMDGVIDTVSAKHSVLPLTDSLKSRGKLAMVGM
ncbi:Alcohol dehydrogenase superfamily, zinc-type [Trema orientale]|uniref:Alcohol dehydrogenase superfamily, zinc-type n=1 Tax=Trema orientale TaxID=63057 RepID=A0A2P5FH23_TREOI|nr:Alcohol dehydrogenase superfamily, zinc-type [Trema orientale]